MASSMTTQSGEALQPAEPPQAAEPPGVTERRAPRGLQLDRFSGLYVFALLIVIFGLWVPETFLSVNTLRNVASQEAITSIVALALLLPFAAGSFDLSVAANLGFSVVFVSYLQSKHGWNAAMASAATVGLGAVVGSVNAFVVTKLRVNSFIATLGASSILGSMIIWISGGRQITTGISEDFKRFGRQEFWGVPAPVAYLAVLAAVIWFVLEQRPVGRRLYATGGNAAAARLSGVRTDRLIALSLVSAGIVAALGGVIFAAVLGAASLNAGPPFLLPAFAAVFLGSTQIHPGRPNVPGTLVAIFVLATGVKGLQLAGAPSWVSELFDGLALILAVALAVRRKEQA